MTTNTTINRRNLLHRALAGAAGAAISAPALGAITIGGFDPVIALIAEEERLTVLGERYDGQLHELLLAQPDDVRTELYSRLDSLPEPMGSLYRESVRWFDAANELAFRIEATKPITVDGAAALLKWTAAGDSPVVDNVIA